MLFPSNQGVTLVNAVTHIFTEYFPRDRYVQADIDFGLNKDVQGLPNNIEIIKLTVAHKGETVKLWIRNSAMQSTFWVVNSQNVGKQEKQAVTTVNMTTSITALYEGFEVARTIIDAEIESAFRARTDEVGLIHFSVSDLLDRELLVVIGFPDYGLSDGSMRIALKGLADYGVNFFVKRSNIIKSQSGALVTSQLYMRLPNHHLSSDILGLLSAFSADIDSEAGLSITKEGNVLHYWCD